MYLSRTCRGVLSPWIVLSAALTTLALVADPLLAQMTPGFPETGRGYQRAMQQQRVYRQQQRQAQVVTSRKGILPPNYLYYTLPPSAFVGSQPAPAAGGLPSVAIVGPGGVPQSFQIEGPIVVNPTVIPSTRNYTYYAPPTSPQRPLNFYEIPRK